MTLDKNILSCKKVGDVFKELAHKHYDLVDFTKKVLKSDYKYGIENFFPLYYTQDVEYYFECFEDWFYIEPTTDNYNEDALYWLGYLFQSWYVDFKVSGEELSHKLSDEQIINLYEFWDIYHTQDTKYVFYDIFDIKS